MPLSAAVKCFVRFRSKQAESVCKSQFGDVSIESVHGACVASGDCVLVGVGARMRYMTKSGDTELPVVNALHCIHPNVTKSALKSVLVTLIEHDVFAHMVVCIIRCTKSQMNEN